MLASRLLGSSSGAEGARVALPRLADVVSRSFAKDVSASQHAGSAQEKLKQTAEGVYESAKRATEDVTRSAQEAAGKSTFSDAKDKASQAMGAAQQKMSELGDQAKDAVNSGGERKLASAQAVWEASRSEDQKGEEEGHRKSQLTNEAFGDNPQESTSRDDKKITESDFYTKA
ncbi:hypothetical protein N2152v2_008434 [Parachlorella kessleri]